MKNIDLIIDYINGARDYDAANHLGYNGNELINYSTVICNIYRNAMVALVNTRKYSATTSKIQSCLLRELKERHFTIFEYSGEPCRYWNCGYMGAPVLTRSDIKVGVA